MSSLLQDFRFSLRVLAKAPGFTIAAILVLALGIGLNTATFNALYALAFSPHPLPASDRLVQLHTQDKKDPASFRAFSHAAYRELCERRDLFTGVVAQNLTLVAVGEGREARRALSAIVSANYFEVLGVPLAHGRGFTANEDVPGADEPVVVVSHVTWRNTGFKPDLVGSTIHVNGRSYTVVGITPENFTGTLPMLGPDFYFPLGVFDSLVGNAGEAQRRSLNRTNAFDLLLFARLQPDISSAAARSALAGIAEGLERLYPVEYQDKAIILGPLPRGVPDAAPPTDDGPIRVMAIVLLGLTSTVLLIVSLNLAGLFLVRGHARRKEFAIRLALGGTRVRLVRQLLTEGFLLALAGGALGCVCAIWIIDVVVAAISSRLPVEIFLSTRPPAAVVGATLVFCTMATLFFALGPALALSRRDLVPDLQQNAGEDVGRRRRRWLPRHPLVVAQIALSLALIIAAGLFARMAGEVVAAEPRVDAEHLLVAEFDASLGGHDRARTLDIFRGVGERLNAVPGVHSNSIAASTPYSLAGDNRSVRRAGTPLAFDVRPATAAEGLAFDAPFNAIGADYFATLGVPLLRGRAFTRFETDHVGAPPVAIIDETLAAQLWPGEDAVGRRLEWVGDSPDSVVPSQAEMIEIVGIARNAPLRLKGEKSSGAIYIPFAQGFTASVFFYVRSGTRGETALARLRDPIRRELQAAAPEVHFFKVQTFSEHKDASLELWFLHRMSSVALGFSATAALIAVIGLYGAKAYGVSRRTREIGIRLALGAEPSRLRNLVLREGLASGALGITLGLLLGASLGRVLHSVIGSIDGFDPVFLIFAGLALFAAVLAASWLPARRATKVNPMVALRTE